MAVGRIGVGIIGCGVISEIYLKNLVNFPNVEVRAVADIDLVKAKARAAQFSVAKAGPVDELLADPTVQIVVNLTIPAAHADVALAAVRAGKSVYNEKPLTITREDALTLQREAKSQGVLVGAAPDTVLGAGYQTCRALIDSGEIGTPVAATAFMLSPGPESWHPGPDFYYQVGGGPMFDMGPYYLTALVNLLGPVVRVTGSARASFPERTITGKVRNGVKIPVEVPTHVAGILDFASGAIGTIITSFDVHAANVRNIEIYGSGGSILCPDPNIYDGPVSVRKAWTKEWVDAPFEHGYRTNGRGLGITDMADALLTNRGSHRANGDVAWHVLDIMHAIHDASRDGRHIILDSGCDRPEPLPAGTPFGPLPSPPASTT